MKKRKLKKKYRYGTILDEKSEILRKEIYNRIGIKKIFRDKKILDLGCGTGADSLNFSKFSKSVVGLDVDSHNHWEKLRSSKIRFVVGNSGKLPFGNNQFDCVFLKDLLHHVKDVEKTLKEIKRVTKKGGTVIILEGNRFNPIFYLYATVLQGHDHFSQKAFRKLVQDTFPRTKFKSIEVYPPFKLPKKIYKVLLKVCQKVDEKNLYEKFRAYNVSFSSLE